MVDPIPVANDAKQNAPNRRTFFDEIKSQDNRLDKIERGSIRSGSVGGDGLRFYDPDTADHDTTGRIGKFDGARWNTDEDDWEDVDGARGVALYEAGDPEGHPWFVASGEGGNQDFQVGYGAGVTETVLLRAEYVFAMSEALATLTLDDSGNLDLSPSSSGNLRIYNLDTVGAGDSLVLDVVGGDPTIKFVVSARKYKQDIEDAEINPEDVLQMRPRTWRDRNEVARDPDTERRFIGFIADELADIPSLRQFIRFNEDGEPESIHYDRLVVALLELLKDQQTKIDDHDEQLENINEKIDQLKNMVESIT